MSEVEGVPSENTNHNNDNKVANSDPPPANETNMSAEPDEPPPPSYDDTLAQDSTRKQSNGAAVIDVTMESGKDEGANGDVSKEANGDTKGVEGEEDKDKKKDEKKEDEYERKVGFFELFRFATAWDWFLIFWGVLWSVANGVAFPLVLLFFGDVTDSFIGLGQYFNNNTDITVTLAPGATMGPLPDPEAEFQKITDQVADFALNYTYLGIGVLVCSYFQAMLFNMSATRQVQTLRLKFFHSVLRQEIGWFDTHESGEMNTRMNDDIEKIRDGMGDKLGVIIQWLTTAVGGFILGFIYSWKLTLVILASSPLMGISAGLMSKLVQDSTKEELTAYAKAGGIAEEVLSAIRTVVAFGGEEIEIERYSHNLHFAKKKAIKRNVMQAGSFGSVYLFMYAGYGLAFWYGTELFLRDELSPGNILIVFFGVLFGAFSLGNAVPHIGAFMTARGAAAAIWEIIDQVPTIDSSSDEGTKPNELVGQITLEDVHFSYPSRKNVPVLKGLNLDVNVGQSVALVGSSGCGKSTVTNLVQRFYDVDQGAVKLDGNNLKDLNVHWLRERIGVVSQEPILFATTIAENIRYGRLDVTKEEMIAAAKEANAHDFIAALPDGYETLVGERGAQLSGGQKQRVAISRALVRNPRILLLDEATSALDTESEGIVQAALDKVQHGRTTIVIAHRLSTIRNSDCICAFREGVIVEKGTHEELMNITDGVYQNLVMMQSRKEEKKEKVEESEDELSEDEGEDQKADPLMKSPSKQMSRTDSKRGSDKNIKRSVSVMSDTGSKTEAGDVGTEEEEDMDAYVEANFSFTRLMKLNSPEWFWMTIGFIGAAINGAMQPCFAIVFARVIGAYALEEDELKERVKLFSILFVVIGVVIFISSIVQGLGLGKSGEELTEKLRKMAFKAMLRQEISWHDDHKNSTGALTTRLATEASQVQGATGARIGTLVSAVSNLGTGIIISFIYGWQLTLLVLAFLPLTVVASAIQWKIMEGGADEDKATKETAGKATGARLGTLISAIFNLGTGIIISFVYGWALTLLVLAFLPLTVVASAIEWKIMQGGADEDKSIKEGAGKIAVEAIVNVRTVASLAREQSFYDKFKEVLKTTFKANKTKAHMAGIAYGASQCIMFFAYAAAFRLGGHLVEQQKMEFDDVFLVFSAIVFGGFAVGGAAALAPDYAKAKSSAAHLLALFDRKPLIDTYNPDGHKPTDFKSEVKFDAIKFRYPTRPDIPVLRGLTLSVNPGETLALVGSSGCGKSTSVSLIERFYDAKEGSVMLDTFDVKVLNISWLRSQVGLVSQEPILFDRTIADNIKYGDNKRDVGMEEVIECAKKANIHDFIHKLPKGYETKVGDKGTQLSGGQKQRVAIARALVRNPKILLLDEATSALDTESERVVQAALDEAKKGRTCITIAHRLSTIHDAEKIAVIRHGKVAELGKHEELMKLKGQYYRLYTAQELHH